MLNRILAPLSAAWKEATDSQVWTSIFRHGKPVSNRNRALVMMSNVFLHLHPVKSRKAGIKLRYTWCMGGITFFLFLVLTFTGLLLMFYYRPTVEYAYADIVDLQEHVPLGIMRELHRWGAHAMVITVWLHMLRVFMTGSYKPPREFNWGIGVVLLVLTLLLSFTGYLLPWDQLAIWAIAVGSNMARATPLLGTEGPLSASSPWGTSASSTRGTTRASRCWAPARSASRPSSASTSFTVSGYPGRRLPDGGALLAGPQGRRYLGAHVGPHSTLERRRSRRDPLRP